MGTNQIPPRRSGRVVGRAPITARFIATVRSGQMLSKVVACRATTSRFWRVSARTSSRMTVAGLPAFDTLDDERDEPDLSRVASRGVLHVIDPRS